MAQNIYSHRTLNSNWFEDRLQHPEALTAIHSLHDAKPRPFETDLAHLGEKYDVVVRQARMAPRKTYSFPDDGFNEKLRTSSVDYADPRTRTEFSWGLTPAPPMINTSNAPVCPPETRPLPGPISGFGAAISRHDYNTHGRRSFSTTNGDFYGHPTHRHRHRRDPVEEPSAGMTSEREEQKVEAKGIGKLTGETYKESSDPKDDTRTQRSWLYQEDPALQYIHHGGPKPPPPEKDNELSLPLGIGNMSTQRANMRDRGGRLFRAGASITARRPPGISVFLDDHLAPASARSAYSDRGGRAQV
mmetsp:Transcript_74433/g.144150  ORF Transcript_74433/g.144150 Transcript_74433/m.144150 type:complete len:302 (+) Transcript_74433:64-969(+)